MNDLETLTTSDPFPEPIMEILHVISTATSTPLVMPMAGLLGMVSGCLGKNCFYESKEGHQITGNMFIALVAGSGCDKTGSVKPFVDAIARYQKMSGIVFKTKDFTSAGLRDKFDSSNCGLFGHFNELSGLFSLLNKSPQFKEILIDCYDVEDWEYLRAGKEIVIAQTCLTILGTIQPLVFIKIIREMGYADGLLARFLPVIGPTSDDLPEWNEQGIDKKTTEKLDAMVDFMFNVRQHYGESPLVIKPSPEARQAYSDWRKNLQERERPKVDRSFFGIVVGKIVGQVLKLAVAQHFFEDLCKDRRSYVVSVDAMNRAIMLGEYFLSQHCTLWLAATGHSQPKNDLQRGLLEAIVACKANIVNDKVLGTGIITSAYNKVKPGKKHLTDRGAGKILKGSMDFDEGRLPNGLKGILITLREIDQIELDLVHADDIVGF